MNKKNRLKEKGGNVTAGIDQIKQNPKFEKSKEAGYTDEEILAYLLKKQETGDFDWSVYEEPDVTEIIEVSWSERIENLGRDYPIFFWSFIIIIVSCFAWVSILSAWKLVKLVLY